MDFFKWVGDNWHLAEEQHYGYLIFISSIKPVGFPGYENIFKDGSAIIGIFVVLTFSILFIRRKFKNK